MKDKLWFFASYQYQSDAKSPAGVEPQFFTDEKAKRVFGKLNWQISPKHKLALSYHNDYYDLPGTPDASQAPSTVYVNTGQNPTPNLSTRACSPTRPFSRPASPASGGTTTSDPITQGPGPHPAADFDKLDTGQITGGIYYWYDDKTYQATASVKVSHFADNFLGASHDFKFGVQYVNGGVHDARDRVQRPDHHLPVHGLLREAEPGRLRLPVPTVFLRGNAPTASVSSSTTPSA